MKTQILAILLMISNILSAQTFINFPVITTRTDNDKPIELKRLNISVFVIENIATTTLEMQFFNNNNRVMEGELNFPLADGVTVSRFALDVNGEMREGVVVEKEKATQAFETVTRRNIDPGLVEITKGNNFKARVYPIPSLGYKKAIIAFEQELKGDDTNFIYQLPVNIKHVLEEFAVKVEVVMNKPKVIQSEHPAINLTFTEARNSYISKYKKNDILLNTQLSFIIPKPELVKKVITYKGVMTPDNYFYININPNEEKRIKSKPSAITIVWDESTSGKDREIKRELAILESYLKWMQNGTIELITFSNTIHTNKRFTVKEGVCTELIESLKTSKFDGATNIGALDFKHIASEEILLFTDGISNFGSDSNLQFQSPVLVINSSNIANHNLLEHIASISKGVYINSLSLTDKEVTELMTYEQKRFIKAEYNKGNIKEFYPEVGQVVNDNFSCVGKAEGATNEVKLHFGFGNTVTETHVILVDNTERIENEVGERIWAQKKLKSLLVSSNKKEIMNHGKKYSLVTPGTSLIVLDRVEDYVRYEITPPQSLLNEYKELLSQKRKEQVQRKQNRIEQICNSFSEDAKWWENIGDFRNQPREEQKKLAQEPPPTVISEMQIVEDNIEVEEEEVLFMIAEESDMDESVRDDILTMRRPEITNEQEEQSISTPTLTSSVNIKKWESDASYMSDLKAVDAKDLYRKYLDLKPINEDNPSFYFDIATYMFQKSQRENGLRVISNLAELELENTELLRILGRKLSEHQFFEEAIYVFKNVLNIRFFEPQSFIDLGMTYAEMGEYQKAIDNLYAVIENNWDDDILNRFHGIELIVLHDINNIIHRHKNELDISKIEKCLIKHMPVDIRIVIDWDANDTDIDLWTTDPWDDKCSYQNKTTRIGGKISNDMTRGYGPEEFLLKYAVEGKYVIDVNYFGTNKQTLIGNITVRAFVYTNFGTDNEHKEILTLQLKPDKDGFYTVGELMFEK